MKIFVVAKDYQQYKYYTHESTLFVYLDRREKIIGIRNPYVVYVGEWYEFPGIRELQEEIEAREPIVIDIK